MANIVFTNCASALLAASISDSDLTIQVATGFGDLFPVVTAPQYAYATLENDSGDLEIVKVTARTGGSDLLTVERAQEGTIAKAFVLTVTRVELRLTKATMEEFAQINGFTMTGDADFNGNNLVDALINGPLTAITNGQIAGVPIRGAIDLSSNEIAVPAGGGRATVGGAVILAGGDDIVAELDTAGVIILDSATVGVRIPASAYFRVEGSSSAEYFEITHDDTDVIFAFGNAALLQLPLAVDMTGNLTMNESEISNVQIVDFGIKMQSIVATSTTDFDYELGSYVDLDLDVSITTLTFSNLPSLGLLSFRLKVVQNTGGETITWPGSFKWPLNGTAPTLTDTAGKIDFIDIWSDDQGTTWYGAFNVDWA